MRDCPRSLVIVLSLALLIPFAALAAERTEPAAASAMRIAGSVVEWEPGIDYETAVLRLQTPDGEVHTLSFRTDQKPAFRARDYGNADGTYAYELLLVPRVSDAVKARLAAAHASGDEQEAARLQREAGLGTATVQSGAFSVVGGAIARPDPEPRDAAPKSTATTASRPGTPKTDLIVPEDLWVIGQACIGGDCTGTEVLLQTLRLKENNTRIFFEDTSGAPFPTTDWQILANDSFSGGANKFVVQDLTAATDPLLIEGGTPTNAIYVDSTGRIGFRTSTPTLDLHLNTGNTPAIRLEQNASGGFVAQTWDIGANEANFFIRDQTNSSRLPFRIRPGAPTSSIDISAAGNVGINCNNPGADLVVASGVGCSTPSSSLNAGDAQFTVASSRTFKENLAPVRVPDLLEKIAAIDVYRYDFIGGPKDRLGLIAEDFHRVFGRGSEKYINGNDVQMALWLAVQELRARVQELEAELAKK